MEKYNDLLINEGFDVINLIISQIKTGLHINDDALREIGIEKLGIGQKYKLGYKKYQV